MSKRRIVTAIIVLVAALSAVVLIKALRSKGAGEGAEPAPDVAVHVGKIVRATLHRFVTAYGTVEPEPPSDGRPAAGALISAPVGGILAEILVSEGRSVAKGAILFRLDTRVAKVAVLKAEKQLQFAETTFERQKQLLAGDGTSLKTYQEAEQQLNAVRSDLAAAKTDLALHEIAAPLSGTLVRLNARIGQTVDPNAVLAEVVALDRLVVTGRVPSREAGLLKPGQPVEIGEGALARGVLTIVGRDIDPRTDTVLVRSGRIGIAAGPISRHPHRIGGEARRPGRPRGKPDRRLRGRRYRLDRPGRGWQGRPQARQVGPSRIRTRRSGSGGLGRGIGHRHRRRLRGPRRNEDPYRRLTA
jgi:multidrug efflux pump subunit AcrA (membrane-fusion protein)